MKAQRIIIPLSLLFISLIGTQSYGQLKNRLSLNPTTPKMNVGIEAAVPVGFFSNYAQVGVGLSAKYEAPVPNTDRLNWTASLGYSSFAGKASYYGQNNGVHFSIVPIQGGLKYYGVNRFAGFYGSAEIGVSVITYSKSKNFESTYVYPSTTGVSFAPGIGYQYGNWDFSGRFQLLDRASYFSFRAAYVFSFN